MTDEGAKIGQTIRIRLPEDFKVQPAAPSVNPASSRVDLQQLMEASVRMFAIQQMEQLLNPSPWMVELRRQQAARVAAAPWWKKLWWRLVRLADRFPWEIVRKDRDCRG